MSDEEKFDYKEFTEKFIDFMKENAGTCSFPKISKSLLTVLYCTGVDTFKKRCEEENKHFGDYTICFEVYSKINGIWNEIVSYYIEDREEKDEWAKEMLEQFCCGKKRGSKC